MKFKDIIGQNDIKDHLQNAIEMNKVSHAYILNGDKGIGKTMMAEAFAATLLCSENGKDACGKCHSCKQAESKNNPDIIYITHEKPNTISVDDVRKQINDTILIKPYAAKRKVYIVPEAEKMNIQAQNALLKTIEEPPVYAVIILLTTNADIFLPTILSRCILLNMKPVVTDELKKLLMEQYRIPDYQADVCIAFSQGNVGKAISLATSSDFGELKEEVVMLTKRISYIELYEMMEAVKHISEYKLQIEDYFDLLVVWYRDVLLYKATADANRLIFKDEVYHIKKQASKSSYNGIENIIQALDKAKQRLNANVNFELVMELLLLTMKEN